jgi:light-regulated signal transduction histidine kinase (bacteriophytochrome)
MGVLVDDMLMLSSISFADLRRTRIDLSALVRDIAEQLARAHPEHRVEMSVEGGLHANADPGLIRSALENLLGNAWKYTGKRKEARIDFGTSMQDGHRAFFVRDNGVGFDMAYADKLFAPFQRLHDSTEFEGTGVGLATVQRIFGRHGGRVWAQSNVGEGATFFFTLPGASNKETAI